jgi:hypothetical protein
VMCSVVGYAKKKEVGLAHHELVDIAIAFDHACGVQYNQDMDIALLHSECGMS